MSVSLIVPARNVNRRSLSVKVHNLKLCLAEVVVFDSSRNSSIAGFRRLTAICDHQWVQFHLIATARLKVPARNVNLNRIATSR
jgi:hypothetical protein